MGAKLTNDLGDGCRYEIELEAGFFWAAVVWDDYETGVEARFEDGTAYLTVAEASAAVDRLLDAIGRGRSADQVHRFWGVSGGRG